MKVATGLAISSKAEPELAARAVLSAMSKANMDSAACVLLFLSAAFAANPQAAIKAAAKAASCTQIIGCSAIGIFTEEDSVIDSPAAAAMVFSDSIWLKPDPSHEDNDSQSLLLTLAAPTAINSAWLDNRGHRLGGVSGDAIGHGAFSVWENAKGVAQGYCEMRLHHTQIAVAAMHGLKLLSTPRKVTSCNQFDVLSIAHSPAFDHLRSAYPKEPELGTTDAIPYHHLMAVYASRASHIERGDYQTASLIIGEEDTGAVTLSKPLKEGDWISWAIRDMDAAQVDIVKTTGDLRRQLATGTNNAMPQFALLFSCLSRGLNLFNGLDQDLALIKALFPTLPLIGFYGNGEIAWVRGQNELLQYAAVIGLFGQNHELI